MMQVCQESRSEIMKYYTLILKCQLGDAVPFNFQHDTLLMDGPDGIATLWSFERSARSRQDARDELYIIHANLKHLAVHGQRIIMRSLNEVQQYTNLETLVLPWNAYWNCRSGAHAFNQRIADRLRLQWTIWENEEGVKKESVEDCDNAGSPVISEEFGLQFRNLKPGVDREFPKFTHYLDPIEGDGIDYSKVPCRPDIVFFDEHALGKFLANGTKACTLQYTPSEISLTGQ